LISRRPQFPGNLGRGGGVIDEDGPFFHCGKGAVCAECGVAQILIIADTCKHEVRIFGRNCW